MTTSAMPLSATAREGGNELEDQLIEKEDRSERIWRTAARFDLSPLSISAKPDLCTETCSAMLGASDLT